MDKCYGKNYTSIRYVTLLNRFLLYDENWAFLVHAHDLKSLYLSHQQRDLIKGIFLYSIVQF